VEEKIRREETEDINRERRRSKQRRGEGLRGNRGDKRRQGDEERSRL
jgi:hypothetical protein